MSGENGDGHASYHAIPSHLGWKGRWLKERLERVAFPLVVYE
jgi:hypothetical protein